MTRHHIFYLIISVVLFTSCVNNNLQNSTAVVTQEPKWMDNPYIEHDKFASIGCAYKHINGRTAQKKLAIARAIDELATQTKVRVQSVNLNKKSVSNGVMKRSTTDMSSLQSVDNISISTKIKDTYETKDGEICVWVVSR